MKYPAYYFSVFAFFLLATQAWGQAGPPLITDDPGTPGSNKWEINFAVTSETNDSEKRIEAPLADINYGVGEHIQLKYEVPFVITKNEENDTKKSGFDRSIAGVKWRFLDKEDSGIAISTYPQYTFKSPVSESIRNSDTETAHEFLLPIELEQSSGKWDFNQEVGYRFIESLTSQYMYGVALTYNFSETVAALGELHGDAINDWSDSDLLFNVGVVYNVSHPLTLLASVGRSLRDFGNDDSHRTLGYIAVQLHL